jgi:hypothetical protein
LIGYKIFHAVKKTRPSVIPVITRYLTLSLYFGADWGSSYSFNIPTIADGGRDFSFLYLNLTALAIIKFLKFILPY